MVLSEDLVKRVVEPGPSTKAVSEFLMIVLNKEQPDSGLP